jgi:hypothetical protein
MTEQAVESTTPRTRWPQRLAPRRGEQLYRVVTVLVVAFTLMVGIGAAVWRVTYQVGVNSRLVETEYMVTRRLFANFEGIKQVEFLGYHDPGHFVGPTHFSFRVNGYEDYIKVPGDPGKHSYRDVSLAELSWSGPFWTLTENEWYAGNTSLGIDIRDEELRNEEIHMDDVVIDYSVAWRE